MKILIISFYFPPRNSVASLRPYSFAKTFANLGHEVTVLTADKPEDPEDLTLSLEGFEVVPVRSKILSLLHRAQGATNQDSQTPVNSFMSKLKTRLKRFRIERGLLLLGRMPDLFVLLLLPSRRIAAMGTWDLVISSYAPYYCHSVGNYLKKRGLCRYWVADFRDLWTKHHQFRGLFPFTLLEKYLESRYLANSDMVVTVSQGLASELETLSIKKVNVITNGYDKHEIAELEKRPVFANDGKIRLVYTGTIYHDNINFKILLHALSVLKQKDNTIENQLEVIFSGVDLGSLSATANELQLAKIVTFIGIQPRDVTLRMQRDSHAQLLFDSDTSTNIPTTKLFEYISSGSVVWRIGRPVLTVSCKILQETKTGFDIGDTPGIIAHRIATLLDSKEKPVVTPNTEVVARYERSFIARQLMELLVADGLLGTTGRKATATQRPST